MPSPAISVLMPAYNAGEFIRQAIDSVLIQSFTGFEFIIINDGSTDNTQEIIDSYNDARIVQIANEKNLGLIASLNIGLEQVKGKYIARFDADDVMLPGRLEAQFKYLEKHPEVGILTAQSICIREGRISGYFKNSCFPYELETGLLAKCTISHSCVTIRREMLVQSGMCYSDKYRYMEDYGLWANLIGYARYAAQPYNFTVNRLWDGSVIGSIYKQKQQQVLESRQKVLKTVFQKFGISLAQEDFELYCRALNFSAQGCDPEKLYSIIKSVIRQIPKPYNRGKRLLFLYYLSIWYDATGAKPCKGCFFINFCSKIWKAGKTVRQIFYRRIKIKVKFPV